MTKKEFKQAMRCGLGRCILELQNKENLGKYRDIVLWGCTHELSFDAQCEGTRAWYLYQMIQCYEDVTPFVETIVSCGEKCITKDSWLFMQCIEILGFFASDGNCLAMNTLDIYYNKLYSILLKKRKRRSNGTLPEGDNFEELCIVIVNATYSKEAYLEAYLKIVSDIGKLMINNSLYDSWRFAWFQDVCEDEISQKQLNRLLTQQSKQSDTIQKYLVALHERINKTNTQKVTYKRELMTAKGVYNCLKNGGIVGRDIPILLTRRYVKEEKQLELLQLTTYYYKERNIRIRTQLLRLLANKLSAPVLDAVNVIHDTQSENAELKEYAFRALSYMRDNRVREYALELLKDWKEYTNLADLYDAKEYCVDLISVIANNYQIEDYDCFVSIVKAIPVTYSEEYGWHSVYRSIRDMFIDRKVKNPPKELLLHIYEQSLCSFCREDILKEMSRRRMLTEDILQECLYDSNEDIRRFVAKKLQ